MSPVTVTLLLTAAGAAAGLLARAAIFWFGSARGGARSACLGCQEKPLRLAPVGICPLRGGRAGPPPGAVEAAGAALGAAVAQARPVLVLAAAGWLALCALPLGFIDWAERRLPDPLTAAAYLGTMVLLTIAAVVDGQWADLARAGLGGIILAGFYLAPGLTGAAGLGDGKLAASLGAILSWLGWNTLIAGAAAGFLLALPYAVVLLATRRARRGGHLAFGPWMIAGTFLLVGITGMQAW